MGIFMKGASRHPTSLSIILQAALPEPIERILVGHCVTTRFRTTKENLCGMSKVASSTLYWNTHRSLTPKESALARILTW
jgi:hypothetical protein